MVVLILGYALLATCRLPEETDTKCRWDVWILGRGRKNTKRLQQWGVRQNSVLTFFQWIISRVTLKKISNYFYLFSSKLKQTQNFWYFWHMSIKWLRIQWIKFHGWYLFSNFFYMYLTIRKDSAHHFHTI